LIPTAIRYLIEGAHQAPSADNSQPWSFAWDGHTLTVRYLNNGPGAAVFGSDSHCEQLTMGAVIENLVQLADSIGMTGDWDSQRQGTNYLRFSPDSVNVEKALDRAHTVFTRHTNRFSFLKQLLTESVIESIEGLAENDCAVVIYRDANDIAALSHLIRDASSMRFRNRQLHEWFGETLRFSPEQVARGNGLDVRTIELPPGGSALLHLIKDWRRMAFLNRLGMYRVLSQIESQAANKSPAFVAVLCPPDEAVMAGRLMERVWLNLERLGLSAQPYYVLSDQLVRLEKGQLPEGLLAEGRQLSKQARGFFGGESFPHMLLRVGYANKPAPRSRRLPLDSVIETAPSPP